MIRLILLLSAVIAATAAVLAVPASADQAAGAYRPIAKVKLKHAPFDACMEACFDTAARERNRVGPEPAAPLYRLSPTQAATGRGIFLRNLAAQLNMSEADIGPLVPDWDDALSQWRAEDPQGDYRPNDLADVVAKYWLFAWMFGAGVLPEKVPEPLRAAARAQMHRLFQSDQVLALLTEGQRQGMAETLIRGQYADVLALSTSTASREQILAAMDNIVVHFESLFDIDLRKLALTSDQGFVLQTSP
jgi:hypothetical protein